jgi:cytoskeletal protein CcmA (bactofilin family)
MKHQKKLSIDAIFKADKLKRKNFRFAGDVIINGTVNIKGEMFVGGNLTITGDCEIECLVCLGNVKIHGNLHINVMHVHAIFCNGDVRGHKICRYAEPEDMRCLFEDSATGKPILTAAFAYNEQSSYLHHNLIEIKGLLDLYTLKARGEGDVKVVGDCDLIDAEIYGCFLVSGNLNAQHVNVSSHLYVAGQLSISTLYACSASCRRSCRANTITTEFDLEVGNSLVVAENVSAGGHIKAESRIQVRGALLAGKSIQTSSSIFASKKIEVGDGYGIYAGLNVPHQLIEAHGFVATRERPKAVRSGYYIKGKRFKQLTESQCTSWPADDGSDGLDSFLY